MSRRMECNLRYVLSEICEVLAFSSSFWSEICDVYGVRLVRFWAFLVLSGVKFVMCTECDL